jgi:hypothetical protein
MRTMPNSFAAMRASEVLLLTQVQCSCACA